MINEEIIEIIEEENLSDGIKGKSQTDLIYLESISKSLESIANSLEIITSKIVEEKLTVCEDKNSDETQVYGAPIYVDNSSLIEKLEQKGITVKNVPQRTSENDALESLSFFMGSRFKDIKPVYENIKKHLNTTYDIHFSLKNATQSEVTNSCQFCTILYQIAFLSSYTYEKSPKYLIHATPNRVPESINFLTGHWLELYVKATIEKTLKKLGRSLEYTYLINPQIVLPNGDDFELDVLFEIDGQIFWAEAKTGNYQRYVQKYSDVAKVMDLDPSHVFMVLTDIPNSYNTSILSSLFKMTVVSSEEFPLMLEEIFSDKFRNLIFE